jgi:hypothetical protein
MPKRSPKYDSAAHMDRVRDLLGKKLARLPFATLVTLLEAATLLEAGESLDTLLARQKLGVIDRVGLPRVEVDRGLRRSDAAMLARHKADQKLMEAGIAAAFAAMPWKLGTRLGTRRPPNAGGVVS